MDLSVHVRRKRLGLAAVGMVAMLLGVAACGGSSGGGTSAAGGSASRATVTVGVLADVTGAAASGNKSSLDGFKAGTYYASRQGYTIKYVVADTATNPATVLSAAQKLVTQDHVLAVLAHSALFFAAAPYLTAHNVPVIGFAQDGREWFSSPNMFSITGPTLNDEVTTTLGQAMKKLGVTNLATLAYSVSPQSQAAANEAAASAKLAGVKVGYQNVQLPFGTTDIGPVVLAMKNAGVDGFFATVDPNTAFVLLKALQDQGVKLKASLLPTGYGGDLTQAGPGATQTVQGSYFSLAYEPVEMQTAATKQFESDLKFAGVTGEPTFAQYDGYITMGLLVRALKAAGADPTSASLLTALRGIHDWDGLGLFGPGKTYDINQKKITTGECLFVSKYEGSAFTPVQGALPICGTLTDQKIQRAS
ncbi:ABC transporter substrate-binding protein [Frankia sp. AgB1.9]|uniref:ABC transporter substrate-binding protein n=1 Tax=unclassified Frankia TaxID=2632575 RepID=UPI001934869E|nr:MULTISPECIES: ABC transporter substrate-binding protein [unclassified Frankia]MBL7547277.1 ABC transporter substrate-binding protein [Frankia sp. AgB1.9]MBL7620818.1 ABC transporter substrate-binding protein [Frankia sp. AgB1.8]